MTVDQFPTPAHEPSVECLHCPAAARQSAATDAPARCEGCGGIWGDGLVSEAPGAPSVPRLPDAPRTRTRRPPSDPDARLRSIVDELLRWHLARAQRATIGYGSFAPVSRGSSTAGVLRVLSSGIVGDGCSGTKGTWRGAAQEPGEVRVVALDVRTATRYGQLGELREVADAIIADAEGDRLVDVELYRERGEPKLMPLSLAQRVGWALAEEKQRAKWRVKFARKDSYPALAGMAAAGEERLRALVERWSAVIEQERRDAIAAECRAEVMT